MIADDTMARYAFLVGCPLRTPAEEDEMQRIRRELQADGIDPGWIPVPAAPQC